MEMTRITDLSEIDILQLQFNILEELKVKRNQTDIEINWDTQKTIERDSKEYNKFRDSVLERDKVCQCCGSKENPEVHHSLPFNQYNSLGADINNGILLCNECHKEYHSQNGYKKNCNPTTLAQFLRDYAKPFPSELNSSTEDAPIDYLIDTPSRKREFIQSRVFNLIKSGSCTKAAVLSNWGDMYRQVSPREMESGIRTLIQTGRIYSPEPGYYEIVL
jgi:5-methylcytosine-specific restriction endonuclease McrA